MFKHFKPICVISPQTVLSCLALLGVILGMVLLSGCSGSKSVQPDVKPMANEPPTATLKAVEATAPVVATLPAPPAVQPIQPEQPAPAAQGTALLIFKITGGTANFCDDLAIAEDGQFILQQPCKQGVLTGTLVKGDLEAFQGWKKDLAAFNLNMAAQTEPNTPASTLAFNGKGTAQPDEATQRLVFDWVNGLIARMQPRPPEPPTPEPVKIGAAGLCPNIKQPAMLVDNYESPYKIFAIDPNSQEKCDIILNNPLFGPIVSAAGRIYYSVFDKQTKAITIWQLSPNGSQIPLSFTSITVAEQFYPFNFTVSQDGTKIAWTRTVIDPKAGEKPPLYRNDLWVANLDGSAKTALFEQLENNEERYVVPIRFTPDNNTLFYALQPNGLGGAMFSGRYDTLYSRSVAVGEPSLIYACPKETPLCIGDISVDGNVLAYTDKAMKIQLLKRDGTLINSLSAPGTDFVGLPVFGPTGNLAFVSITFDKTVKTFPPPSKPGYISFIAPPYTAQPQIFLTANGVVNIWEWLDGTRLAYGMMSEDTFSVGVSILSTNGQLMKLSSNLPLGVWR